MKNRHITCCALTLLVAACLPDLSSSRSEPPPEDSVTVETTSAKGSGKRSKKSKPKSTADRAVASDIAVASDSAVARSAVATSDSIGPLAVNGRYFTVLWEKERYGTEEHIRRVMIRDETGAVHHEDRFDPPMRGSEPEWTTSVGADALRGERGQGLILQYNYSPSAPLSGTNLRILGMQGSRIAPVGPQLSVHGRFGEFLKSREPHVLFLLPDDRFEVEVWQGYFGLHVPYRVRLSGCRASSEPCIRPAIRRGDIVPGLSLLRVSVPDRRITTETTLVIYDAPEGPGGTRISIRPTSDVSIIEAAADVYTETVNGVNYIRTRREWLHVRINGRDGWIHGAESFAAIGLRAAG